MSRFRKSDVQFHSDGYRAAHPAVNIKVKNPYLWEHVDKAKKEFECSEETAEKTLNWAFDSGCEQFWDWAQQQADELFGPCIKVWQEGRSGGWLIVEGLPRWDDWDAIDLMYWYRFQKRIKEAVKFYSSWEYLKETIEGNPWWIEE